MREIKRRLAKLEAEHARDTRAHEADHGLDPEGYARAHAALTMLLSMHPTAWPTDWRDAVAALFPQFDSEGAAP